MRTPALLLLLAAALQGQKDPPTPWRPGAVWSWGEGELRLSAEVWDRVDILKEPCVRVRFRPSASAKTWWYGDLYLAERQGSLLLAGYRIDDLDFVAEAPPVFLPKEPALGQKWTATFENGSRDKEEHRWHDAVFQVEGRERLTLPGGTFDTWKISWSDKDDAEDGFLFWMTVDAGILKIESRSRKFDRKPWTMSLSSLDLKRPDRFHRYPELPAGTRERLDELIGGLRHADPAQRGAAEKAIRELGPGAIPALRARSALEADAEVRARLEAVVRSFAVLKVELRAVRDTVEVGRPFPVQSLLRNEGPEPIYVLPCLPDSILNLGRKYPAISAGSTGPDGQEMTFPIAGSFWSAPRLRGRDFRRLVPGESIDLFAEGAGGLPAALAVCPVEAGKHTLRLLYDVQGGTAADWVTDSGPPDEEALRLLLSMPRGRFEPPPVTVTVTEKK